MASSQPHHVAVWKSPGHWSARLLPFRPFFPITDDFPHSSSNLLIVPDGVTFYITIFLSISSGLVRSHTVLFQTIFQSLLTQPFKFIVNHEHADCHDYGNERSSLDGV